jgi:hypothetical protein
VDWRLTCPPPTVSACYLWTEREQVGGLLYDISYAISHVCTHAPGLFLAPEHADVFKAEQAVYFGNILQFAAVAKCTHASRVAVRHKERGRAATLEFDVDTNKSRDILVEQLSKVVEVYAARKRASRVGGGSGGGLGRGQEEVTVVGALSSVISDLSSSIGSMWSGGAAMDTDRPLLDSRRQANAAGGGARRSAAYRRQISNEGRELFRSSFGE